MTRLTTGETLTMPTKSKLNNTVRYKLMGNVQGEAGEVCGDGGVMGRTEVVEFHRGLSTSLAPDRDVRAGVPPSVGDGLEPDSVGPVAPIWSRE